MFHVRRRPPDYHPRKRKKKAGRRADEEGLSGYRGSYDGQLEPLLIELLPGKRIPVDFLSQINEDRNPLSRSLHGLTRHEYTINNYKSPLASRGMCVCSILIVT